MLMETRPARPQTSTYYARPALKPSHWDWKVSAYIFAAGLAGATQIIATIAQRRLGEQGSSIVRNGRYIAVAGSLWGSILLIADLKTPKRWYNMLRIFRSTSPMSIGTYVLSAFGFFSGLTALGQLFNESRLVTRFADLAQIPAAIAGAAMSCYTAALLSATSTPLWGAATRLLSARFASSAVATGAAALSLGERVAGDVANCHRLDRVACAATAADLLFTLAARRRYREHHVEQPLEERKAGFDLGALALGHGVPLACYTVNMLSRRPSRALSVLAAASVLASSYRTRAALLEAGADSAERPQDYFRFTRGDGSLPAREMTGNE